MEEIKETSQRNKVELALLDASADNQGWSLKMEMNLVLNAHWRGHCAGEASTYLQDGQHSCR